MKSGSLVIMHIFPHPKALGIILREAKSNIQWGMLYMWWEVWSDNKITVESERFLILVE